MSDESTDKLIRDAYGVVAKPDRLLQLLSLLQAEPVDQPERMEQMQGHFDRIVDLLDEIDPNIGDDFKGLASAGTDDRQKTGGAAKPQIILGIDLRIVSIDETFAAEWAAGISDRIPVWVWELDPASAKKLSWALRNGETHQPLLLRLRADRDDDNGILFVATLREAPEPLAELRAIRLRWDERSGAAFTNVLRLTETESQLARYIVDGLSIRQFAQSRDRSIGTARNQLKTLLRKLGIGSQLDLVSLYGGFHASFMAAQFSTDTADGTDNSHVFRASDGGMLPYEIHGKRDGIPLLYLHATADGALLTPRQSFAARANGFRVIAPWLPFYAGSQVPNMGLATLEDYAARVFELLDSLGVDRCPVITVRVSAPYGFAFVKKAPERFDGLVTAGAILPAISADDFAHLAFGYRAPMRLARIAPGFVKLYFAAAAAMIRKGDGAGFFKSLYGHSPADLATFDDPEVIETMRRSMQRTFQDGYNAPFQQTLLSASDWSSYCKNLARPVVMVCGEEDGLAPAEQQRAFCEKYGFELIGPLENVGSLAMHQVPRLIFDTALKLHINRS
ncbi:LuxR C-terminal-related transcriptional regulator [Pontixanthobacter aestiaquae]|uniref:HTH luxR-type domain-containing protein n=1 Tax=Pontixanthobacter aestiaquae TaxID=1509367 RepID=A0A844Z6G2_9SPHN|nr:LuxR C-terminal-related transcriptional regulator [Pontixanthobacter aestiaquae]MDN3646172.1 LuxR C-terminal-related transcriptional regulator [Pontixanthobacter aestiaquae]MXO82836.1 hypothetical protein [Pontixanthobacter aestiaquae]